jgi:hypothetical protein
MRLSVPSLMTQILTMCKKSRCVLVLLVFASITYANLNAQPRSDGLLEWDWKLFTKDLVWAQKSSKGPLQWRAFPVTPYDMYVFSSSINFKVDSVFFTGVSFGENVQQQQNKSFFRHEIHIVVCTFGTQISLDSHEVISRNYPFITFQGKIPSPKDDIEFIGSKNSDGGIIFISTKFHDLTKGQTIIVFPFSNGSFFSFQINLLQNSQEQNEDFCLRIKNSLQFKSYLQQAIQYEQSLKRP